MPVAISLVLLEVEVCGRGGRASVRDLTPPYPLSAGQNRAIRPPEPVSAAGADRADEVPLAHVGAAADVALLGDRVQLRTVSLLERATGLTAAAARFGALAAQLAPGRRGEVGDRAFAFRCRLRLLDVVFRGARLLCGCHHASFESVAFAIGLPATLRCKRRPSPQRGSEQQRIDDPQRALLAADRQRRSPHVAPRGAVGP